MRRIEWFKWNSEIPSLKETNGERIQKRQGEWTLVYGDKLLLVESGGEAVM